MLFRSREDCILQNSPKGTRDGANSAGEEEGRGWQHGKMGGQEREQKIEPRRHGGLREQNEPASSKIYYD